MTLFDSDPGRGYIGRRRHPDQTPADEETIADLVAWRLAYVSGDRDLADELLCAARRRMYDQGHSMISANATIHALIPRIRAEAAAIREWWDRPHPTDLVDGGEVR